MNYFLASFVFFLTLGLTIKTLANEPAAPACTAEGTTRCAEAMASNHKDHSAEMNSLFPEKLQNPKQSARPAVVEIVAPKFLSTVAGTATLQWKEARGANAYHIQVATDPNFKWLVDENKFVKTTSFEFAKAQTGLKYFWRVAAVNTENDASFTKSNFSNSVFIAK